MAINQLCHRNAKWHWYHSSPLHMNGTGLCFSKLYLKWYFNESLPPSHHLLLLGWTTSYGVENLMVISPFSWHTQLLRRATRSLGIICGISFGVGLSLNDINYFYGDWPKGDLLMNVALERKGLF
ncbi:hypothetical protein Ancab_018642 [Ancistrocladus abbreviatus]